MTRQKANKEIIKLLDIIVDEVPDWRFGQILYNLGLITNEEGKIIDPFYIESEETLKTLQEKYNKLFE
jgi:hypothetical protein